MMVQEIYQYKRQSVPDPYVTYMDKKSVDSSSSIFLWSINKAFIIFRLIVKHTVIYILDAF